MDGSCRLIKKQTSIAPTSIANTKSPHRSHARKAIESSGARAFSQDSLSFCLVKLGDLEGWVLRVTCRGDKVDNLHLASSLYLEIFSGLEKYVCALCLVIRLGKWKDEARCGDTAAALSVFEGSS